MHDVMTDSNSYVDRALLSRCIGQKLVAIRTVAHDVGETLVFRFSSDVISVSSESDLDQISVTCAQSEETGVVCDRLASFVGRKLHAWWKTINDAELADGIILAFGPSSGVFLSVMASEIRITEIGGEQFA